MKTQTALNSTANLSRYALATILAAGVSLLPALAAAEESVWSAPSAAIGTGDAVDTGDARWSAAPMSNVPRVDTESQPAPRILTEGKNSGWSLNFTPVLLAPHNDDRLGGGVDPEVKYTLDRGGVRLSAGLRVGGYYAKNLFGITAMPTLRLVVPVGRVEPYVSFGMGYGWLPKIEHSGIATMSRLGTVFRFSESFGLGVEGTIQKIEGSDFAFPSFGSALAINF